MSGRQEGGKTKKQGKKTKADDHHDDGDKAPVIVNKDDAQPKEKQKEGQKASKEAKAQKGGKKSKGK